MSNTKPMAIYVSEETVLAIAIEYLDMIQPNPDKIHDIAHRLGMVYDEYLDMYEDVEEYSLSAARRKSKESAVLLKERDELKAELNTMTELSNKLLTAMDQKNFFYEGYANGSASISEATNAGEDEQTAYSNLWNFLKSKNKLS
jgi:hypothetical protein